MYGIHFPLLYVVFFVATLAVPFVAYRLTRSYGVRLRQSGYTLSYGMAWSHGAMLYLFASIILLLPQYMFYSRMLPEQLQILEGMMSAQYAQTPTLKDMMTQLYGMDPLELFKQILSIPVANRLISSLSNNVLVGALLSLINAYLLTRKKPTAQ